MRADSHKNIKSAHKKVSGISLIETLVYIAIFGLMFVSILEFLLATSEYDENARQQVVVEKTLIFIDEHLRDSFENANSVNQPASTFGVDNGVLTLDSSILSQLQYKIDNGTLEFNDDTTDEAGALPITPPGVTIEKFYLTELKDIDEIVNGVRIEITLTSDNGYSRSVKSTYIIE